MKHKLIEEDDNHKKNSDHVISKQKKRKIEASHGSQTDLVKKEVKHEDSNNIKNKTPKDFQGELQKNAVKKEDVAAQSETAKTKTKKQKMGKPKQSTAGKDGSTTKATSGKLKKKLKKQASGGSENKSCREKALEYLRLWKQKRSSWSFQKVRQTWLLQNLYSQSKINDEDFETLLEYLEHLQGKSRDLTIKQAEKIISDLEDDNNSEKESNETISNIKEERARKILQILS